MMATLSEEGLATAATRLPPPRSSSTPFVGMSDSQPPAAEGSPAEASQDGRKSLRNRRKKVSVFEEDLNQERVNRRFADFVKTFVSESRPMMDETVQQVRSLIMDKFMKVVINDLSRELASFDNSKRLAELRLRADKIKKRETRLKRAKKKVRRRVRVLKARDEDLQRREEDVKLGRVQRSKGAHEVAFDEIAKEFMSLDSKFAAMDDSSNYSVARLPQNIRRNRYSNILPYNASIVHLPSARYINASHLDFNDGKSRYIGCQWPLTQEFSASLENSEDEFWEMVFEHKVKVIVALQAPAPMKHHYYWPHEVGETLKFPSSSVSCDAVIPASDDFHVYKLTQSRGGGLRAKEIWKITLLSFLTWPDHGIPTELAPLYTLGKTMNSLNTSRVPGVFHPIIVHCSAGVGRTGVFIACDLVLNHGIETCFKAVEQLRLQRPGMVENVTQYKYVFDMIHRYEPT